uniref:Uncharacterized protein n=1 Tax=Spongospora subterranea TaxID=70186 RepID=A0A0H5R9U7_9EUKA|eukprot:CRZ10863.1 hypothetical protein [Spongospora subterranea]
MAAASTIRCGGEFFNPEACDSLVGSSARVCAYCHSFQVDSSRIVLCRSSETPFTPRKRLIRVEHASVTLDLRFFAIDKKDGNDGLLVFKDKRQAEIALSMWPKHLSSLPDTIGPLVEFVKCRCCRRKVHPVLLESCTKPSCMKRSQIIFSKKRPSIKADNEPVVPGDVEKRRRQWRICPDSADIGSWPSNQLLPRAVIQSPEPLCAEKTSVRFAGNDLHRDFDFFCGLKEVVIPVIPYPKGDFDSDGELKCQVEVNDETGVSGSLRFTFRKLPHTSDLDEQIQRLHLFEEDEAPNCTHYTLLSPLFKHESSGDIDLYTQLEL